MSWIIWKMKLHQILNKKYKTIRRKKWAEQLEIYPDGEYHGFLTNEFPPSKFEISSDNVMANDWESGKGAISIYDCDRFKDELKHILSSYYAFLCLNFDEDKSFDKLHTHLKEVLKELKLEK